MKRLTSVFALFVVGFAAFAAEQEQFFVASKKGVLSYQLDEKSGQTRLVGSATNITNPGFLAVDSKHHRLFVLNSAMTDGKRSGVVSSFNISRDGGLQLINQQKTSGGSTHLDLDHALKNVLVANYGAGTVAVYPIDSKGSLGGQTSFLQHKGSSIVPKRQEGPHAHFITTDAADHFALTCDLGLDQVLVYKFSSATGKLDSNDPPYASLKPGAGPRHLVFHPNGKFVYVINELDSTMTVFAYDAKAGSLKQVQNVSTLPKGFEGKNYPAEVAIHPSGKFVYGSNRGHDSIVVFAVDSKNGTLTAVDHVSSGGKTPRQFEVDPAGNFLVAGNQDSNDIVTFRINSNTGGLTGTSTNQAEAPMCIKFVGQ